MCVAHCVCVWAWLVAAFGEKLTAPWPPEDKAAGEKGRAMRSTVGFASPLCRAHSGLNAERMKHGCPLSDACPQTRAMVISLGKLLQAKYHRFVIVENISAFFNRA